jgi:hypothetical protein
VRSNSPTEADFASAQALGKAFPRDPENIRLATGISVYATENQARRKVREAPALGMYIAELRILEDGPVRYERTLKSPGHHILWAEPKQLLASVVAVVPA